MEALDTPGKRLKWARVNRTSYSTATGAAEAFGWTVPTYLGHENGDRNPSVKAAMKYAAAYKVPWHWILEGGPLPGATPAGGDEPGANEQARRAAPHQPRPVHLPADRSRHRGALQRLIQVNKRGRPDGETLLPVSTIVGAGDEIVEYVGEDPIDEEPAPPGLEDGEVTEVRGRSMLPALREGDRLFHRFLSPGDHTHLIGEMVVARLKDGRRFVKVLRPGSRRGRYNLHSINDLYPPLEDQQLDAVAEILWVKRRQRSNVR